MLCCYLLHHETWYGTDSGVRVLRLIRHMKTSNLQSGLMALQGLKSVAEQLWRHRDKHAAQLADRQTLRKVIQTDPKAMLILCSRVCTLGLDANSRLALGLNYDEPWHRRTRAARLGCQPGGASQRTTCC